MGIPKEKLHYWQIDIAFIRMILFLTE